ncbi:diguanylate cyclase [Deinococcus aerius]|uniref:Diguanylate cyclase n=1 Tax=Deinococcus aerius TaxID=200253 RepID=A0A2I9DSY6_9DEIO|nr:GGDEF domain-containing protein [Deinococcus aerius]GBF05667.1 diguanylate cyclase [Deinococcus aerius]
MTNPPQHSPPRYEAAFWQTSQRRMFALLVAFGTLACVGALWAQAPNFDPLDRVALPVLALILLGLQLALLLRRLTVGVAATIAYGVTSVYFLLALEQQFRVFAPQVRMLSESTYWFPVLYAGAFLLYPPRRAAWLAGTTYLLAFGVCVNHLVTGASAGDPRLVGAVAQFLLVGAVMIIVQATFGVQRVQLLAEREAAYRDALTGLANRRAAEERLAALAQDGDRFTLVLFDLDHFKAVNDQHGHATGDLVLRGVAQAAQGVLPRGGVAARWGGEEFLLILPVLSTRQVREMLDTLRAQLGGQRHGEVTGITASFGVATAREGEHPDAVLARADAAMYAAKHRGRNDVQHADLQRTHHGGVPEAFPEDHGPG